MGTAPPSHKSRPHVRAVGSIPVSVTEDELATPCRGSWKKRTTVTVPGRSQARTGPSSRRRKSVDAETLRGGRRRGGGSGDLDPPRGPRPRMTQRFLRTRLCPQVSARSPARHQPADSLLQRSNRRRGPGSPSRRQPSVHGPDLSGTVHPAGMEGWERGARMLSGISSSSSERLSVPTGVGGGVKVRRHLSHGNFSSRAGLELSAWSGRLHSPKQPCSSGWDPAALHRQPRPAAANHRAPREGKAGGRWQPQSDGAKRQ